MSDMMKCFVMHGIGKVGVMEKPVPRLGPIDAIIRTTATLICTSSMSDKTIRTALCPGGSERMGRLLRLIETGRVDPLALTTHRFAFKDIEKAFRMMQTKEDGMIKPLILFS